MNKDIYKTKIKIEKAKAQRIRTSKLVQKLKKSK